MAKELTARQRLRKNFLWLHRWLGIISGLVVFIVAITGCLYVFEKECRQIFQKKYYFVTPQEAPKKSLTELQQAVVTQFPKDKITLIRFKEADNAAVLFNTKTRKLISVNPYTADVIGARNMENDFFNIVLRLHRTLMMGHTGEQIIKWNVLIFFILCISGLIIWWPKQKRFFKQAVRIKFRTKNWKRLNWDLHSVLGFYALLVLFIISLTGMFWVFDWVQNTVKFATRQPMAKKEGKIRSGAPQEKLFPLDSAYRQAAAMYPGATDVFIGAPADSEAPIRVNLQYPYTLVRKQNALFFDQYSGKLIKENLYKNYTAYDKVARSNYQLHTGDMPGIGIGMKIIYFLASLIAASLPITGLLVWLGRKKKVKKKVAISEHIPATLSPVPAGI